MPDDYLAIQSDAPALKQTITGKMQGEENHRLYDKQHHAAQYQYYEDETQRVAEDPIMQKMSREQLQKTIDYTRQLMMEAAKSLDFLQAAQYRDELIRLEAKLKAES